MTASDTLGRLFGVVAVILTAIAFTNLACDAFLRNPNWWGVFLAFDNLYIGFCVIVAVVREYLS